MDSTLSQNLEASPDSPASMKNYKVFLVPDGYTPVLVPNDASSTNGDGAAAPSSDSTPNTVHFSLNDDVADANQQQPPIAMEEEKPKKIPRPKNSFMTCMSHLVAPENACPLIPVTLLLHTPQTVQTNNRMF